MLNLSLMESAVLQPYGTMRKFPDNLVIVGYHEDRCPPEVDPFQELHDRLTRFRIQISCRFICNEQSRIIGEGPGDHHALPQIGRASGRDRGQLMREPRSLSP